MVKLAHVYYAWYCKTVERLLINDLPRIILTAMAIVHGLIASAFGIGLLLSVGATSSKSYVYLVLTPGWPTSIGSLYLAFGCIVLFARARKHEKAGLSTIGFLLLSLLSVIYGGLFLAGTFGTNGVYGPQYMYLGFSTLYLMHSIYSSVEWLKTRNDAEHDPITVVFDE